jgi:hypothetical protein
MTEVVNPTDLESRVRVAEELLFMVVRSLGPVELTAEELHQPIGDNILDLQYDQQRDIWTIQVTPVETADAD